MMSQSVLSESSSAGPETVGGADREEAFAAAVVVPVIDPVDARRLLPLVSYFSERLERPIELVTIIRPEDAPSPTVEALAVVADNLAATCTQPVRGRVIISDTPAATLIDVCVHRLVLMPTAATPFRHLSFVGSHAAAILARSSEPVILVGPDFRIDATVSFEDLVVALSGDEECLGVLPAARPLAEQLGLAKRIVHVVDTGDHPGDHRVDDNVLTDSEGHARLWFPGSLHTTLPVDLLEGSVGSALAATTGTSLLMLATHARCGLARIAQGSVAFDAVAEASGPVVVVGPHIGDRPSVPSALHSTGPVFRCAGSPETMADNVRSMADLGLQNEEIIFSPMRDLR